MSKKNKKDKSAKKSSRNFITAKPQQLDITLYQGGQAVVREARQFDLSEQQNLIQFDGLPSHFDPNSLTVLGIETAGKGKFNPGSLCYRSANLSRDAILAGSIGREISLVENAVNGRRRTTGKLLAVNGNQAILQMEKEDKVALVSINSQLELAELPEGLSNSSSLIMEPTVTESGAYTLKLLYETGGLGWEARYTALYDEKGQKLDRFDCFVRLENESGATFENAKLKLLAASNGAQQRGGYRMAAMAAPKAASLEMAGGASDSSSESVGEKHMYTLPGSWTLENGETKQVCLFSASNVPVQSEYYLPRGGHEETSEENLQKQPVFVRLRLLNHKDQNLGAPLPAGQVNIFQADSSGAQQKTDSVGLAHVSEGEKFKIEPQSPCADLKATRRAVITRDEPPKTVKDVQAGTVAAQPKDEAPRYATEKREVTVCNHKKDRAVTVLVQEAVRQDAELIAPSMEPIEKGAREIVYKVEVPASGSVLITYTTKYRIN